jgi:hypothetical protein
MLNGTGIRNAVEGGYIPAADLGIKGTVIDWIETWLQQYAEEHYNGYSDKVKIDVLDTEGKKIAETLQKLLPCDQIMYFSDALLVMYPCS